MAYGLELILQQNIKWKRKATDFGFLNTRLKIWDGV